MPSSRKTYPWSAWPMCHRRPSRLWVGPPNSRRGAKPRGHGDPLRRRARLPDQLAQLVQPEQAAVVADRARPAGRRRVAAIEQFDLRAGRCARSTAACRRRLVNRQAMWRRTAPGALASGGVEHRIGAAGFADGIDPQAAQALVGRDQRHFAAARIGHRQPAVGRAGEGQVGAVVLRRHHVPQRAPADPSTAARCGWWPAPAGAGSGSRSCRRRTRTARWAAPACWRRSGRWPAPRRALPARRPAPATSPAGHAARGAAATGRTTAPTSRAAT